MAMVTKAKTETVTGVISAPNIRAVQFKIVGNAPYMQARFAEKAIHAMMGKMDGSVTPAKRGARDKRDFDADYRGAMHLSTEGWAGIPASSIRAAMISACRLVGFKMTLAKLSVFVKADGFDKVDGQPLIQLYGEPERCDMPVRNATGVFDIRVRPMWRVWHAMPVIQFDADQFSVTDVANLLARVGMQVGLGEGRPDSRMSTGLGYGTFDVVSTGD